MEKQDYRNAVRFLEKHFEEYMDEIGDHPEIGDQELERIRCFLSAISKGETIIAMKESGYSERSYYRDGIPVNDYRNNGGGNYSGRYEYNRRDGGNGWRNGSDYSHGGGEREEMIAMLENAARDERDERRRETMQDMIRMIRKPA